MTGLIIAGMLQLSGQAVFDGVTFERSADKVSHDVEYIVVDRSQHQTNYSGRLSLVLAPCDPDWYCVDDGGIALYIPKRIGTCSQWQFNEIQFSRFNVDEGSMIITASSSSGTEMPRIYFISKASGLYAFTIPVVSLSGETLPVTYIRRPGQ